MVEAEGNSREVVGQNDRTKRRGGDQAVPQGTLVGQGLFGLCNQDIPSHGSVSERVPFND
jgi:hypothetical protein